MGIIMKEVEIAGDKGRKIVMSLFDSGASCSVIRKDVAEEVSTILKIPTPFEFILGDGETTLRADYVTFVEFTLKGYRYPPQRVIVVDKLEEELIFGVDTLQMWKIKLDFVNEDVVIDKSVLRLRLV